MAGTSPAMTKWIVMKRGMPRAASRRQIAAFAIPAATTLLALLPVSHAEDCPVVFQRKLFADMGDVVEVSGSLPDFYGYKYNTVTIACYRADSECLRYDVESIGSAGNGVCQISRIDPPMKIKIQQWSDAKIVANSPGFLCGGGETWVIDRRTKTADVTWYPPACPTPLEQTFSSEKKDLEAMLKEQPELNRDPRFTEQMSSLDTRLAAAATYRQKIQHATIEDPPFWQEWKKKFKPVTGHEPR
jgi:hypothetical protein